jgi:hypothetical protein
MSETEHTNGGRIEHENVENEKVEETLAQVLVEKELYALHKLHNGFPYVETVFTFEVPKERIFQAVMVKKLNNFCDRLTIGVEVDENTWRFHNLERMNVDDVMTEEKADAVLDSTDENIGDML